ncbi:DUF1775 domain-containing protein [Actinacidiphila glaucinigra]|uniref:DUF1775 domain-containing protein n=1 Tax=Actinacidiphila glaucinigra TaxID=235986 RepID=UPI002E37CAE8|nr:DUF1775 domain-containing protein [Actinacidiphila glaucinigra]
MSHSSLPSAFRRTGIVVMAASAAVLAVAAPAAAHAEVSASTAQALAENVTLTFESEAESASAGFTKIRIVLPDGIATDTVRLKEAPKGWKLAAGADGYTVGGPALAPGTNAEHSIVVRQLPDASSLAFKTLETYSDGEVSRWIEVPKKGQAEPENPAPVLDLKPAASGATPIGTPAASQSPSPQASASSPAQSSPQASESPVTAETSKDDDGGLGAAGIAAIIGAVVVVAASAVLWMKRRSSPTAS